MKTINVKSHVATPAGVPKPGERFERNGHEYIALGIEQGGLLAIAEKPIAKMPFDRNERNNWRTCTLRKYLNGEYLDEIGGKDGLLPFVSDLTSDDGMTDYEAETDYVFLLSCDLYRKYRAVLQDYEACWWTLTPWSCRPGYASGVRVVRASGALVNYYAYCANGVVPSLLFHLSSFSRAATAAPGEAET